MQRKLWVLAALLGCSAPPADRDQDPGTATGGGPTGGGGGGGNTARASDEGQVSLMSIGATVDYPPLTMLAGVFVEADRDWLNLAQCLTLPTSYCTRELPTDPETWVPISRMEATLPAELTTRDVGDRISLGEFLADYQEDPETGLGLYADLVTPPNPLPDKLGFRMTGGYWGEHEVEPILDMAAPMRILEPSPLEYHTFHNAEPVRLRWEPDAPGQVYLSVLGKTDGRLYLLEDDGSFDLDLRELDLYDYEPVTLSLGRWTFAEADLGGNALRLQVQSDQIVTGTHRDVQGREWLEPADTCDQAQKLPYLEDGFYYGDISTFANNLSPGEFGCTGFGSGGRDGMLPVVLEPDDRITVTYQLPSDDAAVYLVTDCTRGNTCVLGADDNIDASPEVLDYLNDTGARQELWLVLDAFRFPGLESVTDLFFLDVAYTRVERDVLSETCAEATLGEPLNAGIYYGDLGRALNRLDPAGLPQCPFAAPGGEGIGKVLVQPGQTVVAEVSMPGGNPVVYFLYQCNLVESCASAWDFAPGPAETGRYTNNTPFTEYLYLVVDSAERSGEYYLSLSFE